MRFTVVVSIAVLLFLVGNAACAPLFKVFCSGQPLFRGRVDTIVNPGVVSGHVHKFAGANHLTPGLGQSNIQVYNDVKASTCTTCSLKTVDNSVYWHPDLYYKWPNGSLSLVPTGGLTVYYLHRAGDGAQANPKWKAFPPGFRMVSGNPFRRTYDANKVEDRAISYACLSSTSSGPETPGFPTNRFCNNGLRLQVHFPQCWDGVNIDSANHKSHVAFPTRPDGGNCPASHPVRLPDIFFEAFYSVDKFPHGTGTNPFVLSCGDSSGYGFHGDFLNGWDQTIMQQAIDHPSCDASSTNNGNNVKACVPLAPFVQETPAGACKLRTPIPLTEHVGLSTTINKLPGCNAITGAGQSAAPCTVDHEPSATHKPAITTRFILKSVLTTKFVSVPSVETAAINANSAIKTYGETITAIPYAGGYVALAADFPSKFWASSGPNMEIFANRGGVSDWELFQLVAQPNNRVAIISKRNGKYLTVAANGVSMAPTSSTIGNAQLFEQILPDGGNVY